MHPYEVLLKKRDGLELTCEEITEFVNGFVSGQIPDYQMAAWLMAIYYRGMNRNELLALNNVLVNSGETLDLSSIPGIKVDKHSTGGVGDKTTLVLIPLVASCGVPVIKLSGKSLGHTGGTLDKLSVFPGYRHQLEIEEIVQIVKRVGGVMAGHSENIAPADKKIYHLRNLTATTESIPLIASSVMSKKIAGGSDAFVLDVKCGQGAFMKNLNQAHQLAETMVEIASLYGKKAVALITNMEQPLGYAIGNTLEVLEAIRCLKGEGPADLEELVLSLGSEMLILGGKAKDPTEAIKILKKSLDSGLGLFKLKEIVSAQGGDISGIDSPEIFGQASVTMEIPANRGGYIQSIDAQELGLTSLRLQRGRDGNDIKIDLLTGLVLTVKQGDKVSVGDVICQVHASNKDMAHLAKKRVEAAITIGEDMIKPMRLIEERISSS